MNCPRSSRQLAFSSPANRPLVLRTKTNKHLRPSNLSYFTVRAAESDAPTVQSWDIVVLKDLEGSKLSLARVLIAGDAIHTIELLEEESRGEFAATGIEQEINSTQIVTVITDFDYKQIQVDRAINPHGEHAEEIFTIPITSLPSEY